jgi:hypothetical protein
MEVNMLRRLMLAVLVVASLACMVQDAKAAGPCRPHGKVVSYLFGGYGPGPFGKGFVNYAGHPAIYNYNACGRVIR